MTEAHPDHAPELSAQDARQARWGAPVLAMLVVSTLLAGAALLAAWAWRSGDLSTVHPQASEASAKAFHAPDSNAGPTSPATPATRPTPPPE